MFKNYLKIALRNIKKQKGYAFINITGLAIGMACCFLILIWVVDELRYDRFLDQGDRIYRVTLERQIDDNTSWRANSAVPMGEALKQDIPEIEESVRFWRAYQPITTFGEKRFRQKGLYYTDPAVFSVFSFQFLAGNPDKALVNPSSIVLTMSYARMVFGDEDPIGKILTIEGYPLDSKAKFNVTGIMEDLPRHSQFDFTALASIKGIKREQSNWGSIKPIWTYVLLNENATPLQVENHFPKFVDRYFHTNWSSNVQFTMHLESLKQVHLYSEASGGFKPMGNIVHIYVFSVIGIFILFIACSNFVNLTTTRAIKRAKEVGLRKVLGAQRVQLITQFWGEVFFLCLVGMILALLLALTFMPFFEQIVGKSSLLQDIPHFVVFGSILIFALLVGLAAGSYPAFFLSGLKPILVLKGGKSPGNKGHSVIIQRGSVILQFVISGVLIAGTVIVYKQLKFIQGQDLGFNKEHVVVLPAGSNDKAVISESLQNSNVISASVSQRIPVNPDGYDLRPVIPEGFHQSLQVDSYIVDEAFLGTYGIQLLAGENFSEEKASTYSGFLINETAVKTFGWSSPEDALHKQIDWGTGQKKGPVVGVVENFFMRSLRDKMTPLVMQVMPDKQWWHTYISIRIRPTNIPSTLASLEKIWKEHTDEGVYSFFFIDSFYDALYRKDLRFGRIIGYFAALAILIACLGLFGLSSYAAETRVKEIGIRKILGASAAGIVKHLSIDFLKLVVISFLIAIPLAYFIMNRWLGGFAYRITPGADIFILSGVVILCIAWMTVGFQSFRAAHANPVESLREE